MSTIKELEDRIGAIEQTIAHLVDVMPKRKGWFTDRQWERISWFMVIVLLLLVLSPDSESIQLFFTNLYEALGR